MNNSIELPSSKNFNEALLKLFKVYTTDTPTKVSMKSNNFLTQGVVIIENGKIASTIPTDVYKFIDDEYAVSNLNWANCFHKTLDKVATASIEQLLAEQVTHYFSTYGLEFCGLQANPYIPVEKLELDLDAAPNIKALTVIQNVTEVETQELIYNYLTSLTAPNVSLMTYIETLLQYSIYLDLLTVDDLKSFELKAIYYSLTNNVPVKGDDFLRFIIYKLTNRTLLIKNRATIGLLRNAAQGASYGIDLRSYFTKANINELAKVFYRFKPLFLACKNKETASIINKIRRMAVQLHQPISDVRVANLTTLANAERWKDVSKVIDEMNLRNLIKVFNYLSYIINTDNGNRVYNIRNSKVFINVNDDRVERAHLIRLAGYIEHELSARVDSQLDGQVYYIPDYINYTVPVSEKQFTNTLPYGTSISTPDGGYSIGIAWNNIKRADDSMTRVDLDLHLTGALTSYGWNSAYRDDENQILFSGDMTDATNGAAEVFYVNKQYIQTEPLLATINNFCGPDVEYKFVVTGKMFDTSHGTSRRAGSTPPIDMADALFTPINLKFTNGERNNSLGVLNNDRFYFYNGMLNSSQIPNRDLNGKMSQCITDKLRYMLSLEDLLQEAGAKVIHTQAEKESYTDIDTTVIDLSPNVLQANTLMDIVNKLDK